MTEAVLIEEITIYLVSMWIPAMVLITIYSADIRLKFALRVGLRQVKLRKLAKSKYFFVYQQRKEGVITEHAFVYMIVFYVINALAFAGFLVYLNTSSDSTDGRPYGIFCFFDLALFGVALLQPALKFEKQTIMDEHKRRIEAEKASRKNPSHIKEGNVYAIPLPDGKYAFCRKMSDATIAAIAVYKHIGDTIEDTPQIEEYRFIANIYYYELAKAKWPLVDHRPFENEDEAMPPPVQLWDQKPGRYEQYYKNQIIPSTKAACMELERALPWTASQIVDRIIGGDDWKEGTYEWAYIKTHGQKAYDKWIKDS